MGEAGRQREQMCHIKTRCLCPGLGDSFLSFSSVGRHGGAEQEWNVINQTEQASDRLLLIISAHVSPKDIRHSGSPPRTRFRRSVIKLSQCPGTKK
jgi:hypothetical protein